MNNFSKNLSLIIFLLHTNNRKEIINPYCTVLNISVVIYRCLATTKYKEISIFSFKNFTKNLNISDRFSENTFSTKLNVIQKLSRK